MTGFGLGGYGGLEEGWGSIDFPGSSIQPLGDFQVSCRALSEGFSIEFTFVAPTEADAPTWNRTLRILRKIGEWPQSFDDSGATIVFNDELPISQTITFTNTNLAAGVIYYYQLFAQRDDGTWISDRFVDRCSAYPYDRWGACEYLYDSMPRGFRSHDVTQHLFQFMCILGAIIDNNKTDVENLLTLMEVDTIHEDLLFALDRRLGWPTWYETGGLQRRDETKLAVSFYKIKGTKLGYEGILSELADYDVDVLEGWRYVMFSNGLYDSITPDFNDPDTASKFGTVKDIVKYTSDSDGWHSVGGLAFVLTEVPGVSESLSAKVLARVRELISLDRFLVSYATAQIFAVSITEEEFAMTRIDDDDEISVILSFELGTYSRTGIATDGTGYADAESANLPNAVNRFAANVPRFMTFRGQNWFLCEDAATNIFDDPEAHDEDPPWTVQNLDGSGVTQNAATSPEGTLTAEELDFSTTFSSEIQQEALGIPDNVIHTFTTYIRIVTGSEDVRTFFKNKNNNTTTIVIPSVDTTWRRVDHSRDVSAGGNEAHAGLRHNSTNDDNFYIWGSQFEVGEFPTSFIPGDNQTRSADDMAIDPAITGVDTPDKFSFKFIPSFSSDEHISQALGPRYLLWFGDNLGFSLQLLNSGPVAFFRIRFNGNIHGTFNPITWDRFTEIQVDLDLTGSNCLITVTGLTSGVESQNFTDADILPEQVMFVGQNLLKDEVFYGYISELFEHP